MRRGFIKARRGELGPIGKACEILRVSKSEHYDYLNRPEPNAQIEREAPEGLVAEKLGLRKGRYGHRRIDRELRRDGIAVSGKRVLAAMRRPGLQAKGTTRRHGRAKPAEKGGPRASLVNRVLDADAGNRLWAGDITYIGTDEGRPCLAAVIDARHRKVVGWSTSGRITERLAIDALDQAVGREGPPDDFSPVFRDGQGSRYASRAFQRRLESHGMARSMPRPGNPRDDAAAESLSKTLRREPMNGRRCKSRDEARQEVFKYIELYCNRRRLHSKNDIWRLATWSEMPPEDA